MSYVRRSGSGTTPHASDLPIGVFFGIISIMLLIACIVIDSQPAQPPAAKPPRGLLKFPDVATDIQNQEVISEMEKNPAEPRPEPPALPETEP